MVAGARNHLDLLFDAPHLQLSRPPRRIPLSIPVRRSSADGPDRSNWQRQNDCTWSHHHLLPRKYPFGSGRRARRPRKRWRNREFRLSPVASVRTSATRSGVRASAHQRKLVHEAGQTPIHLGNPGLHRTNALVLVQSAPRRPLDGQARRSATSRWASPSPSTRCTRTSPSGASRTSSASASASGSARRASWRGACASRSTTRRGRSSPTPAAGSASSRTFPKGRASTNCRPASTRSSSSSTCTG